MKKDTGVILSNKEIVPAVYRMEIRTELGKDTKPGQFFQVSVPGFFLRRPISTCEVTDDGIVLIYRISGDGTAVMSSMHEGTEIGLFGPLGTGFPVEDRDVILIGGGVGVPPLYETAKAYRSAGHKVTSVLGFASASLIFLQKELEALGCDVVIATVDGSCGIKGTVLDAVDAEHIEGDFVLSCGPMPMLRAVAARYPESYVSLESRMACGFGACMGCVVHTPEGGSLRVCKDGPVFKSGEVVL